MGSAGSVRSVGPVGSMGSVGFMGSMGFMGSVEKNSHLISAFLNLCYFEPLFARIAKIGIFVI